MKARRFLANLVVLIVAVALSCLALFLAASFVAGHWLPMFDTPLGRIFALIALWFWGRSIAKDPPFPLDGSEWKP